LSRSIGVVTTSRSDYSVYLPVLRRIQADSQLRLLLFVSGAHLSPQFGLTVKRIEEDGFPIVEKIEVLLASDSPTGIVKAVGLGLIGFADAFSRTRPDLLLVLGDRFEMLSAAVAALPFRLPVAHIHGGEATFGAIDESIRHAITKLSHLHFVATQSYADRVIQMGEAPERVMVSGAPALDLVSELAPVDPAAFECKYGLTVSSPLLLVTYHPVTLELEDTRAQIDALLGALDEVGLPLVFTEPNADAGGAVIRERIDKFLESHERACVVPNFGPDGYFDALRLCTAMIGNSSSGIIEAASFELPVVNVGTRQEGRVRAKNVIDVGYERAEIAQAIRQATSADFRTALRGMVNPYGDGQAAERIVARLKSVELDERMVRKSFHNIG